jgi:type IV pilus assembly protein PilM
MSANPFKSLFAKSFLGVDIGTSSFKVVELSSKNGIRLENYGQLRAEYFTEKKSTQGLILSNDYIIAGLSSILQESKIRTKETVFAVPDYATFFTSFDLPAMSKPELEEAIRYEAPRHIPLPLSEVTLDWEVIKGNPLAENRQPLKVMLVAVPNETISQYDKIARALGLKIIAMETEVFSLARALIKYQDKRSVLCLIDCGQKTTTINIFSQNILKTSHSVDISSEELTQTLADTLKVDLHKAEIVKRMYGLSKEESVRKILAPQIDILIKETREVFNQYFLEEKEKVEKIIMAGGIAHLPGLKEYFLEQIKLPMEIANPFIDISYPPGLDLILKKIGPEFTIAVGAALRGLVPK